MIRISTPFYYYRIHNDSMAGFYRSGYTDSNGSKKYLVVTQFEATDCRRCFPSWDEVQPLISRNSINNQLAKFKSNL